jgi:hypothetical protein
MARTEVHSTLKRIRRQLHSGHRSEVNLLDTTLDDNDTSVVLSFDLAQSVIVGAELNIELELMRVTAVDRLNRTCTVIRAWQDSTADAHLAGAEVHVNPRFSLLDLYEAMLAEIQCWGPDLFRVEAITTPIAADTDTYQLPAAWENCYAVLDVRRYLTQEFDTTPAITSWPATKARLIRGVAGSFDGAPLSGLLLRLVDTQYNGSLYVQVALPILLEEPLLTDDLVDDAQIPESLLDVLELGIKLRVFGDGEIARTSRQAQDDARLASETPPGSLSQSYQLMIQQYRYRKNIEINKLRGRYPVRMM